MDDATSEIYSAFFVAEDRCTMSSFQVVSEATSGPRACSARSNADRASHYWNTPEAGGKVDKDTPTQVGRALQQLDIELIAAYSPEAIGGAPSACSAPCRNACPRNSGSPASPINAGANRFLTQELFAAVNTTPASRPRPKRTRRSAFVPFTGALDDIRRIHEERTVSNDNTPDATSAWNFRSPPAAKPPPLRQGQGPRPRIPRRHNGRLPWTAMSGAIPRRWPTDRQRSKPARPRDRLRRDRPAPCGQVDSRAARPDHFPTGPATATEAVDSWYVNRSEISALLFARWNDADRR